MSEPRNHPLFDANRQWARDVVAADPDEALSLTRDLGESLGRDDLGEHLNGVMGALHQALLDELAEQGLRSD